MNVPKLLCKIMIGISGSGKSTFISNADWLDTYVVSDDNYFISADGKMQKFDRTMAKQARNNCLIDFINQATEGRNQVRVANGGNSNPFYAVRNNPPVLVVDNINSTLEDIIPFISVAEAYGYEVELIILLIDPEFAVTRSQRQATSEENYLHHYQIWNTKMPNSMKHLKRSFFRWNEQLSILEPN